MGKGIDCATKLTNTTALLLKKEGIDFVGRYLGNSWKGLSVGEVEAISEAGLKIFSIFETNPTKVTYFTNAKGKSDAADATKYAQALGQPKGTAIYFAVDYDVQTRDFGAILDYFKGVKDALEDYEVGAYGEYDVINLLHDHGLAKYFFQTYAWSHGKESKFNHIFQHNNGQKIAGIGVDLDEIENANVGAWSKQVEEKPQPKPTNDVKAGGTYKIKSGDTLWDLEEKNDWSHGVLQKLNPGLDPKKLKVGQTIKTPGPVKGETKPSAKTGTYVIKFGDTFWDLEKEHGWESASLQKLNPKVDPKKLHVGDEIVTPSAVKQSKPAPKAPTKKYHTTVSGESLSVIAEHNGISLSEIIKLNPQVKAPKYVIHPGDKIRIK